MPPAPEPEPVLDDPVGIAFIENEALPAPLPVPEEESDDAASAVADETASSDEPELAVLSLEPEPSRSVRWSLDSADEDPLACGKAATLDTRPRAAIVKTDEKLHDGRSKRIQ